MKPESFTARSLVGMTTGARKRAVRREFDLVPCPEYLTTIQDRMQWYLLRGPYLRAKYRIGERLRPCPGCKCCGYPPPYGKLWTLTKGMWRMGSLYATDIKHICDGSGVLPARKQK